jgi:hypothetical protein
MRDVADNLVNLADAYAEWVLSGFEYTGFIALLWI